MHICTYEAQTQASKEALWQLWTQTKHWPTWDTDLASAELSGPFRQGVTGTLTYKDGTSRTFTVIKCEMLESLVLSIPFVKGVDLIVKRDLKQKGAELHFQQELAFTGAPFAKMMQKGKKEPITRATLKQMEVLIQLLEGQYSPFKDGAASGNPQTAR